MVKRNNEYIVAQILAMDDAERAEFIDNLKPETLRYLDIVLEKATVGSNITKLKRYLDNHK
jgi:hypothetical protein